MLYINQIINFPGNDETSLIMKILGKDFFSNKKINFLRIGSDTMNSLAKYIFSTYILQ